MMASVPGDPVAPTVTNIEAEQSVLGSLLIDPRAIEPVSTVLDDPGQFWQPEHVVMYRAMLALHVEGTPADVVTLSSYLQERGQLDDAGGLAYFASLATIVPTSTNGEHYARIVEQAWRTRKTVEIAERAVRSGNFDQLACEVDALASLRSATNGTGGRKRRIVRTTLADVQPRQREWFFPPYLAFGTPALLVGDGGVGKSTLASLLAARASAGKDPLTDAKSSAFAPFSTIIVSTEEDPGSDPHVVHRYELLKADRSRVHYVQGEASEPDGSDLRMLSLDDEGIQMLRREMELTGARLLILDPMLEIATEAGINPNRADEVRRLMKPLRQLARDCHAVVLALIHVNRAQGVPASARAQGSADFRNFCRSMLVMAAHPENSEWRVLSHDKSNLGTKGATLACSYDEADGWTWRGEIDVTADDALSPAVQDTSESAIEKARNWLRDRHKSARRRSDVVADAAEEGIHEKTLQRAYRDLGGKAEQSVIEGKGRLGPWMWPAICQGNEKKPTPQDKDRRTPYPDDLSSGDFGLQTPDLAAGQEDACPAAQNGFRTPKSPLDNANGSKAERQMSSGGALPLPTRKREYRRPAVRLDAQDEEEYRFYLEQRGQP